MKMQIIFLLLLSMGLSGVVRAEDRTEVPVPDFGDEAQITGQAEKCIARATEIDAQRTCYEKCTSSVMSTMATKICLALGVDVEKVYLEEIYQKAVTALQKKLNGPLPDFEISYNREMLRRLTKSEGAFVTSLGPLCDFESASFLFGSGEGVMNLSCLQKKYQERSALIEENVFP